ncbi:MAG: hypothetical protein ACOX6S_05880 [Clostridia bacterium]|jgi:hypothetical protein
MSVKKTICLQEVVYKVAQQKARMVSGGNFSSYINLLIYKDNEQEIIKEIQEEENRRPQRDSAVFPAQHESQCVYCKRTIRKGERVCYARHPDGQRSVVHKKCCRD